MNLLDSVLSNCKAEHYADNFKQFGIDAFTLKILNDEDLKIVGVTEDDKRALILQHAANLQIPAEKYMDVIINKEYIESVLLQMSAHIVKHLAVLSIAVNRKDIIICNVKVAPAACCLRDCILSLDKQMNEFEEKVLTKRRERNTPKKIIMPMLTVASVILISYKLYESFPNKIP